MYNILIVDFSDYKESIKKIFVDVGYNVELCNSAFSAISKMKAYDFDLVVSEIELPGDNSFDLYEYVILNYPYIPVIMTTDKNIDMFFERIFNEGIGNVLCKPVKKEELINLADKLITKKNIFGLENYMKDIIEIKKIRISSSLQIQKGVDALFETITAWGFEIINNFIFTLVLNEMLINAVYHSHGLTEEKKLRIPVKLKEGEFVDLFFARNKNGYGIAITDYNGKLSKMKILDSINKVVKQEKILDDATTTGEDISELVAETGRGIDFLRKLSTEYYFIVKQNVRTEIILLIDDMILNDDNNYSSMKIIEALN